MPYKTMKLCAPDIKDLFYLEILAWFLKGILRNWQVFVQGAKILSGFKQFLCTYVKENKIEATKHVCLQGPTGILEKIVNIIWVLRMQNFCLQSYFPSKNVLQVHKYIIRKNFCECHDMYKL